VSAPCLFCEIVAGRVPAAIVFEDDRFIAFLDHRPLFPGHVLLLPRDHHATLPDLPAEDTGALFQTARLLSMAVQQATDAHGTFVAVNNRVSQSVPHLHVHIVPRREKDGLKGFFWPRRKYLDNTELENIQIAIQQAMQRISRDK
jgi:histidine triad (HIT) family protein